MRCCLENNAKEWPIWNQRDIAPAECSSANVRFYKYATSMPPRRGGFFHISEVGGIVSRKQQPIVECARVKERPSAQTDG